MNAATETRSFRALFAHLATTADGFTYGGVMTLCGAVTTRARELESTLTVTLIPIANDVVQVVCDIAPEMGPSHIVVFFIDRFGHLVPDCFHIGAKSPEQWEDVLATVTELAH